MCWGGAANRKYTYIKYRNGFDCLGHIISANTRESSRGPALCSETQTIQHFWIALPFFGGAHV